MKLTSSKPLFTLQIRKRHILIVLIVIAAAIVGYSIYFRQYMTLPPSSIHIIPEATFSLHNQRVMVFSPHCDDETLGTSGVIQRALEQDSQVEVVMVTDCNKHKIGSTRKAETETAMSLAGLPAQNIRFLDFAEGKDNRPQSEKDQMKKDFRFEIDQFDPTLIFSPHPEDTHSDHRIVGQTLEQIAKEDDTQNKMVYYLIHYNFLKYPSPPGLHPDGYLTPPARLINFTDQWYKFSLSDEEESIKEEAVSSYRTQLKKTNPILTRVLYDFVRRNELFMIRKVN